MGWFYKQVVVFFARKSEQERNAYFFPAGTCINLFDFPNGVRAECPEE
ncbi:MAG TPA: hypothetical protein VFV68_05390 [Agriterribacter sp.]|nr:hypothetical protein [Agriterribacter sp.]